MSLTAVALLGCRYCGKDVIETKGETIGSDRDVDYDDWKVNVYKAKNDIGARPSYFYVIRVNEINYYVLASGEIMSEKDWHSYGANPELMDADN